MHSAAWEVCPVGCKGAVCRVEVWAEVTDEEVIMVPAADAEGTMDQAEAPEAEAKAARAVAPVAVAPVAVDPEEVKVVDLILGVAKADLGVDEVDAVAVATSQYLNSQILYFR